MQFLLNSKAYINAKTKLGLTALHLAAQKGYKDIVDMLVTQFSASIDALSLVSLIFWLSFLFEISYPNLNTAFEPSLGPND